MAPIHYTLPQVGTTSPPVLREEPRPTRFGPPAAETPGSKDSDGIQTGKGNPGIPDNKDGVSFIITWRFTTFDFEALSSSCV